MSRSFILACVFAVGSSVGFAEEVFDRTVYWQIDFNNLWTEGRTRNWSEQTSYAQLVVSYADLSSDTPAYFFKDDGVTSFTAIGQKDSFYSDQINWSSIEGASFYVELYGELGDYLARSEAVTFNDLLNTYHAVDVDFAPDHLVINHSSMWEAIHYTPEPNSALLVLLGLAGLSLRRRRV